VRKVFGYCPLSSHPGNTQHLFLFFRAAKDGHFFLDSKAIGHCDFGPQEWKVSCGPMGVLNKLDPTWRI